jgi:hypothetical protein
MTFQIVDAYSNRALGVEQCAECALPFEPLLKDNKLQNRILENLANWRYLQKEPRL